MVVGAPEALRALRYPVRRRCGRGATPSGFPTPSIGRTSWSGRRVTPSHAWA